MIHAFNFDDPVEAHEGMCETLMFGNRPGQDYDWTQGTEVGLHNVAIHCKQLMFDYNLKDVWVARSRWTKMVRDYIDPGALNACIELVQERLRDKGRGIAVLRTRTVQGRGTGRNVRRRWGSCMLNLSFRATPVPTVSLHSRTTYFGYLAIVDATVARTFGVMCAAAAGINPQEIEFVWTLDLAQFHGFRSLAWALSDAEIREQMEMIMWRRRAMSARVAPGNQPGYRKALDGYARILKSDEEGVLYGDEAFSSFCRIRRRFHTEVHGFEYASEFDGGRRAVRAFSPLPDLFVSTLDFESVLGPVGTVDDDE